MRDTSRQDERAARSIVANVFQHWDATRAAMNQFLRHPGSKGLSSAQDLADFLQADNRMSDLLRRINQNIEANR